MWHDNNIQSRSDLLCKGKIPLKNDQNDNQSHWFSWQYSWVSVSDAMKLLMLSWEDVGYQQYS